MENTQLRIYVDSLSRVVDSLRAVVIIPEDSELAEVQAEMEDTLEYSPEVTDSLLDIWLNARKQKFYERDDYDMDVDTFSFGKPITDESALASVFLR